MSSIHPPAGIDAMIKTRTVKQVKSWEAAEWNWQGMLYLSPDTVDTTAINLSSSRGKLRGGISTSWISVQLDVSPSLRPDSKNVEAVTIICLPAIMTGVQSPQPGCP